MILHCSIGGDVVGLVLALIVDLFVCKELITLLAEGSGGRVQLQCVIRVCRQQRMQSMKEWISRCSASSDH
jgi:hypothetical protein